MGKLILQKNHIDASQIKKNMASLFVCLRLRVCRWCWVTDGSFLFLKSSTGTPPQSSATRDSSCRYRLMCSSRTKSPPLSVTWKLPTNQQSNPNPGCQSDPGLVRFRMRWLSIKKNSSSIQSPSKRLTTPQIVMRGQINRPGQRIWLELPVLHREKSNYMPIKS